MAKINLAESNGAFISQPGKNVLLVVTKSKYDQEYGKVEMTLENENGEIVSNNFGLIDNDGSINDGALKAFSYFSRVAVGDWGRDDIEDEELIGCFVRADIEMVKGKKEDKNGNIMEFANIAKCYMTNDRFEKAKKEKSVKPATTSKKAKPVVEDEEDWD